MTQRTALLSLVATCLVAVSLALSCGGSTPWSAEPSPDYDDTVQGDFPGPVERKRSLLARYRVTRIGTTRPENPAEHPEVISERIAISRAQSHVAGAFRNTYYDFPSEANFSGKLTTLYNARCEAISRVSEAFHDTLCVQGSGLLKSGSPVSFAKRGCSCARTCPATKQKICYQRLDRRRFPWGRGATGKPITPLLTIAVDTDQVPMNSAVYIPEYEGLPLDREGSSFHDGCFLAQDRGLKVKGKHVDIFTGDRSITRLWNELVPSNKGVTVVLQSPKCTRAK